MAAVDGCICYGANTPELENYCECLGIGEPPTIVVNIRDGAAFDIFIGRGGPFGNPFIIGRDGNRSQVIEKYRVWAPQQPQIVRMLPSLEGKRLGCFCKPKACHGDVLVEMVNAARVG